LKRAMVQGTIWAWPGLQKAGKRKTYWDPGQKKHLRTIVRKMVRYTIVKATMGFGKVQLARDQVQKGAGEGGRRWTKLSTAKAHKVPG